MAKITLSVPDELYEKIQKHREVNWSEEFRKMAQALIKKLETKGELVQGLLEHLRQKLSTIEENREVIRKREIERFTRKWGEPDRIKKTEEPPVYITITKDLELKVDEKRIATLKISNSRTLAQGLIERVQKGQSKLDLESFEKLKHIVEYLKSKGFYFESRGMSKDEVLRYVITWNVLEGGRVVLTAEDYYYQLIQQGITWYGLFASDGEDYVFLGYKEVRRK